MKLESPNPDLSKIKRTDYKSPVQFELEIQRKRILHILDSTIDKMEIMATLPSLIDKKGKLLQPFLKTSELEFVLYACNKYLHNSEPLTLTPSILHYTQMLDNITLNTYEEEDNLAKTLLGSLIENEKVDYYISQVIQIITTREPLLQWLKKNPQEIDQSIFNVIACMKHFKDIIYEKLMISSAEQIEKDKKLQIAFKSNFLITQNIKKLQEQIEKQREELGSELEKKNAVLRNHQNQLESLNKKFQADMMKKIQDSEKKMMEDSYASEATQAELGSEMQEASNQYNSLLENNLQEESQLRAKRNKVEAQLASWLQKYDTDVGEKQAELEKLEEQYKDMQIEFEELQIKFDLQSEEYDILMAERDAEQRRIYEEKAYKFLMNRSARIIQRAWRAYWKRKLERKRMRKEGVQVTRDKKSKKIKSDKEKFTRTRDPNSSLMAGTKNAEIFEDIDTSKKFE